jgi:hypothetical protein
MKKILFNLVCGVLLFNLASIGAAADSEFNAVIVKKLAPDIHPIDQYSLAAQGALMLCGIVQTHNASLAKLQASGGEVTQDELDQANYRRCISKHKAVLTNLYGLASKALKKPSQKTAIKEYYVLSISTLGGIDPMYSERVIDYERRTNAEKRALDLQLIRLEAEK